jgi:hypothetical protein
MLPVSPALLRDMPAPSNARKAASTYQEDIRNRGFAKRGKLANREAATPTISWVGSRRLVPFIAACSRAAIALWGGQSGSTRLHVHDCCLSCDEAAPETDDAFYRAPAATIP